MALKILQVSTSDFGGGAEQSANNLAIAYRALGHDSWLAVGQKAGSDPNVFLIPNKESRNAVVRGLGHLRRKSEQSGRRVRGLGRLTTFAQELSEPSRLLSTELGREDFDHPGTDRLLELTPAVPDIMHVHNLHGGYFDLRALPKLSRRVPTILNVHDAWLASGHCAFSLECERWKTGCGHCPDLTLYPAVKRDATRFNWQRKQAIFAASRLYVTAPSKWMMDRVNESIINLSAVESRVIPNGVDTHMFFPSDRAAARHKLGLESNARVLLVAANALRSNVWKDFPTLRGAIQILGTRSWPAPLIVLAVGESAPAEKIGGAQLRFVAFERDRAHLAEYYRAADVYLHAARVESFGTVLLEARACGTPVVATAIGGIPEQIRGLGAYGANEASGLLVEPANPAAFAEAITLLLDNAALRETIAANGLRHVQQEFSLELQVERFLGWYQEILDA